MIKRKIFVCSFIAVLLIAMISGCASDKRQSGNPEAEVVPFSIEVPEVLPEEGTNTIFDTENSLQADAASEQPDTYEQIFKALSNHEKTITLYYRVVVFIDPLQGLCYNAEDAVDW